MWIFISCISLSINFLLLFYVRWLLKTLSVINEDVESVSDLLMDFTQHTQSIYEMEMFYGDQTLESLIQHSKELTERLKDLDLVINQEQMEEDMDEAAA